MIFPIFFYSYFGSKYNAKPPRIVVGFFELTSALHLLFRFQQLGSASVGSTGASATMRIPVDVRRNFDLSVDVVLNTAQACNTMADGFTVGFSNSGGPMSPVSGGSLGLDPTKRIWAATLDPYGNTNDGSNGPNSTNHVILSIVCRSTNFSQTDWHSSFVSTSTGAVVFTHNFYNATVISCAAMKGITTNVRAPVQRGFRLPLSPTRS